MRDDCFSDEPFVGRRSHEISAKALEFSRDHLSGRQAMELAYNLCQSSETLLDWASLEHGFGATSYALDLSAQAVSRNPENQLAGLAFGYYLKCLGRTGEAVEWLRGVSAALSPLSL